MQASTDRMISVSISDVTFNSASRLLYRNNKFHFDETFSTNLLAVSGSVFLFFKSKWRQNVEKIVEKF